MSNHTDKAARKLSRVKISLMRNPMFALWSGIMMVGKTELRDDIPMAMTNGRDEYYGRKLVEMLTPEQLAFVVLHENLHKAFRHLTIWRKLYKEDAMLANMACDYVINLMLVEMDPSGNHIQMPKIDGKEIGLLDKRFEGMNAKQVYDILKQEQKGGKGQGKAGQGGQGGQGQGGQGQGGQGQGQSQGHGGFDEHDWDGADELTEAEQRELEREIDQALRQGVIAQQKAVGNGGGNIDRAIGELLEPEIDWREVLREFVTAVCSGRDTSSWRRPNRRFLGQDTYLPTMVGERVGHIAIGIDTSGSIGGPEINRFLSEVRSIAEDVKPDKVDLIYWDARVAGHEQYDEATLGSLIESTKPKGGGGTDPTCMMKHLKKEGIKPECIIMLTDGCIGNWGSEWDAPILWVVCGSYGRDITAPVGKTVHIKD